MSNLSRIAYYRYITGLFTIASLKFALKRIKFSTFLYWAQNIEILRYYMFSATCLTYFSPYSPVYPFEG